MFSVAWVVVAVRERVIFILVFCLIFEEELAYAIYN